MGKNTKNKTAKRLATPGRIVTKLVKNTYFAQNKDVPGKPIVTKTANMENTHSRGADNATPPM